MIKPFKPTWISAPGETILDLLEENGWSQKEFAERCGYDKKHINQLVNGKASITEDTALRFEKVLGSTAGFWLKRETQYREAIARKKELAELETHKDWLKEFPINEMIKFGWIEQFSDKAEQVRELLEFFGVSSPAIWRKKYPKPSAAFRASKTFEKNNGATTAWLRQGEIEGTRIECEIYERNGFKSTLQEIRALCNEPDPKIFGPRLVELCADAGVAFVLERAPKGCPVSGATRWLSKDKALIMLSLRYKTNDHFWFSFFHEAAHILLHGKKMMFLETGGMTSEEEEEADKFARDFLIPPEHAKSLSRISQTYAGVNAFAEKLNIPPGIVVGRMHHDKIMPYNRLAKVKVRYSWK